MFAKWRSEMEWIASLGHNWRNTTIVWIKAAAESDRLETLEVGTVPTIQFGLENIYILPSSMCVQFGITRIDPKKPIQSRVHSSPYLGNSRWHLRRDTLSIRRRKCVRERNILVFVSSAIMPCGPLVPATTQPNVNKDFWFLEKHPDQWKHTTQHCMGWSSPCRSTEPKQASKYIQVKFGIFRLMGY